mmetsp:Transcript_21438/g.21784  ORF Transcript_21438/g.21784 Transcript_21438/m.21784 type:complete len:159 (-) Transcript_21438:17-493(-)
MDREEADATPSERWKSSLNATCNRITTQYLSLLRSAAGTATAVGDAEEGAGGGGVSEGDRSGGGLIADQADPPPPPIAADAALNSLQVKLAAHNLCVASSNLLELIRTLRLAALLMDETVIESEERDEFEIAMDEVDHLMEGECVLLESELMSLRNIE